MVTTTEARSATASGSDLRLWLGQVRYAWKDFWHTPVAAFFTLGFPLVFLVMLSALYGNEVVDPATGVRLAQFITPRFAVFGVVMASFSMLAISVVEARETGVLKRLRGTPLPPRVFLSGRIGNAVLVSVAATVLLVGVGVVFYDVQIVSGKVAAAVVTLVVGIGCFAALGLAVTGLVGSTGAATAVTTGIVIPLGFISGIFAFGTLPTWLQRVGDLFPLKSFTEAFGGTFDPYTAGTGFAWADLGVMLAWGVAGVLVALRAFRWEPVGSGSGSRRGGGVAETATPQPVSAPTLSPPQPASVTAASMLAGQSRYGIRQMLRERTSTFFGVAFPALLVALFGVLNQGAEYRGMPLAQYLAGAMAVYGIATMVWVNLPQTVAQARTSGVLKRLQGTPMPAWSYVGGRVAGSLVVAGLAVLATFAVAVLGFGVRFPAAGWPALVLTFVVTTLTFAAMGLALAVLAGSEKTVTAVALGTLLPLSFVSEIFLLPDTPLPPALNAIGWAFPLRHSVTSVISAITPGTTGAPQWGHLGVIALWGVAGAALAIWGFRRRQAGSR